MIHKFAGVCLIIACGGMLIPVVFGGGVLVGILQCLVPLGIVVGLVLVLL